LAKSKYESASLQGLTRLLSQSVAISNKSEKVLAFLNDPVNGALFDEKEPMVLKRLVLPSFTSGKDGASGEASPAPAAREVEESAQVPVAGGIVKE